MNDNLKELKNRELKDTSAKQKVGTVYGNVNGVVDFHTLGHILYKDNMTLFQYIDKIEKDNKEMKKTLEAVRKAELVTNERVKALEKKIDKYGII